MEEQSHFTQSHSIAMDEPAILSGSLCTSAKWIQLDDLQSPWKLEHSMPLLPWDLFGFGMKCCKHWRHKESVDLS